MLFRVERTDVRLSSAFNGVVKATCLRDTSEDASHDHWETTALTGRPSVGKVTSQLFHMLSGLLMAFLPRSKRLLISWLQSPSAVILEPKKMKSATVSTVSPSTSHEVMGPDAMIL